MTPLLDYMKHTIPPIVLFGELVLVLLPFEGIISYKIIDCQPKCNTLRKKLLKQLSGSAKAQTFSGAIIDQPDDMLQALV